MQRIYFTVLIIESICIFRGYQMSRYRKIFYSVSEYVNNFLQIYIYIYYSLIIIIIEWFAICLRININLKEILEFDLNSNYSNYKQICTAHIACMHVLHNFLPYFAYRRNRKSKNCVYIRYAFGGSSYFLMYGTLHTERGLFAYHEQSCGQSVSRTSK